ncbi:MAG: cyclic nucleotide-binding domain-containing protein [bacterium]|nr:cyclic nucleotide-binding domain-containing protein [bacterium]
MPLHIVEFKAGETIFKKGEPGTLMYLLQEGEVEVVQEFAGVETQLAVLKRKDFFGEMSILDKEPRSHLVRALSDAKLVEIRRADFQILLRRNPDIAVRMVHKLSNRLAATEDMVMRAHAGAATISEGASAMVIAGNARLVSLTYGIDMALPDRPEVKIGRFDPVHNIRPDIDLTPIDPQLSTSRKHALILRRADFFSIQEEQATNGTLVNGQRISAERPLEIRTGDEITFGAVQTRFTVE